MLKKLGTKERFRNPHPDQPAPGVITSCHDHLSDDDTILMLPFIAEVRRTPVVSDQLLPTDRNGPCSSMGASMINQML